MQQPDRVGFYKLLTMQEVKIAVRGLNFANDMHLAAQAPYVFRSELAHLLGR